MKVALVGSGGSGKTTLVDALCKKYLVDSIPEYMREYLADHKVTDIRNLTPREQMDIQWWILGEKFRKEQLTESFIADRSTADNLAYVLRWCAWGVPDSEVRKFYLLCKEHINTYDAIILCPWGVLPIEADGVRSAKKFYQYEMHCLIEGILMNWKIPYIVLNPVSLDARIEECSLLIQGFM